MKNNIAHWQLKTSIALFIFNRPDTTEQVFAEIAKVKPPKLLVIADGPRIGHPSDGERCKATRAIIEKVDWDCKVLKNYSDINLGCKRRVSSGLNWVFNMVEEAIILEDDCLPHPSFFRFCEELLEKYRNNEQVALISGANLFLSRKKTPYSYYFSRYPQIWGWASWRRFWKHYDVNIKRWSELRNSDWLKDILGSKGPIYHYWEKVFDATHQGKTNTWDYQMVFALWAQKALAIIPQVNLISNIGWSNDPNFRKRYHKFARMKTKAMKFPLVHPPYISRHAAADKFTEKYSFTSFRSLLERIFLYLFFKIRRWLLELFRGMK